MTRARTSLAALLLLSACVAWGQQPQPRALRPAFPALRFALPVFLTHAGDGTDRVFVVEKAGVIRVFANEDGVGEARSFLDIRSRVNSGPNEAGLLSVAFHPRYRVNGRFYVYYTYGNLASRVSELRVGADVDAADPESELVLWETPQPASNHNGGQLAFGPDGMLYIGLGDGGGAGDTYHNGQDPTTWLGSILRIDVDGRTGDLPYGIPADNPFVGNLDDWREEIWAYGLRNPWRFSFDRVTGRLWAGDVGQNAWEEIDLIEKGGNYGWNVMEGFECFRASSCDRDGLAPPVVTYGRGEGISVTGGYVYRGRRLGELYGTYLYGDFGTANIWGLRYDGTAVTAHAVIARSPAPISSFGEDEAGEVYVVGYDGRIFAFEPLPDEGPTAVSPEEVGSSTPRAFGLGQSFPNPFNGQTAIPVELAVAGDMRLEIRDALGRPVRQLLAGPMAAGRHEVAWDGRDDRREPVGSGVYLCTLRQAGKPEARRFEARRLLLLR